MEEILLNLLGSFVAQYPWAVMALTVIGTLRVINKPLFSFFRTFVNATDFTWDNAFLDKVEGSKIYKAVSYVLDWTASIKLPKKLHTEVPKVEEQKAA